MVLCRCGLWRHIFTAMNHDLDFSEDEIRRYSRHILLNQLGVEAQEIFLKSHALIIGAGGLGAPTAFYLASAGVGTLTICDNDEVDLTNLQRQIIHNENRVGINKAESAEQTLKLINSDVKVNTLKQRLEGTLLEQHVAGVDVVLDCSDNFSTRYAINSACVKYKKPLVSGAAIRFDGQISVFDLRDENNPCYGCLFPESAEAEDVRCATMGVFAPLVGIIGSMQAAEALKVLAGVGQTLNGRLLMLDALSMEWHSVNLTKDYKCSVCSVV